MSLIHSYERTHPEAGHPSRRSSQDCVSKSLSILSDRWHKQYQDFGRSGWHSPSVLAQTVFYGQIMCIYLAKWDPVAAIAFFETGCDISQNAKQLIIGRTVSAAGMCAYTCLSSCSVVLTLEVWDPNNRLRDTDHHPSYPSPGPPKTLLAHSASSLGSAPSSVRSSAVRSQIM